MRLRTFIFWPHLVAGVLSGVVILVMSVTGVLLTYERQFIAWSDSGLRSSVPATGPRLPVEAVLATFAEARPGLTPEAVTVGSDVDAPVVLAVGRQSLFVDAYSGAVLGEGRPGVRRFMSNVKAWHRWLAAEGDGRATARAITGWSNVVFLFLVASGLYLWFPRRWTWRRVKPVVLFTAGARGKARDFNWHNVIGVWSLVPLFVVVASAIPISFPWGNALVYRVVGDEPPAGPRGGAAEGRSGSGESRGGRGAGSGPVADARDAAGGTRQARGERAAGASPESPFGGLNEGFGRAEAQVPGWTTITVRLPHSTERLLSFAIDAGTGGQPQRRSTLAVDRTGRVVTYESFSDLSPGRRLRSVMRFAHTGEVLGVPGQTLAGVVSAAGAVLVWTGMALALRRGRAWAARRRSRRDAAIQENPAA